MLQAKDMSDLQSGFADDYELMKILDAATLHPKIEII